MPIFGIHVSSIQVHHHLSHIVTVRQHDDDDDDDDDDDILSAEQPFWYSPGIQADRFLVESTLSSPFQRAAFLVASSQHSGDWLYMLYL